MAGEVFGLAKTFRAILADARSGMASLVSRQLALSGVRRVADFATRVLEIANKRIAGVGGRCCLSSG